MIGAQILILLTVIKCFVGQPFIFRDSVSLPPCGEIPCGYCNDDSRVQIACRWKCFLCCVASASFGNKSCKVDPDAIKPTEKPTGKPPDPWFQGNKTVPSVNKNTKITTNKPLITATNKPMITAEWPTPENRLLDCCMSKGMSDGCIDLCSYDRFTRDEILIAQPDQCPIGSVELLDIYNCLTQEVDHSECCKQQAIPSVCGQICNAKAMAKLDHKTQLTRIINCTDYDDLFFDAVYCFYKHDIKSLKSKYVPSATQSPLLPSTTTRGQLATRGQTSDYDYTIGPEYYDDTTTTKTPTKPTTTTTTLPSIDLYGYELYNSFEADNYPGQKVPDGGPEPESKLIDTKQPSTATGNLDCKTLDKEGPNYLLQSCCENLIRDELMSEKCLDLCFYDVMELHGELINAFLTDTCPQKDLSLIYQCMAHQRDHTGCCTTSNKRISSDCLPLCNATNSDFTKNWRSCVPKDDGKHWRHVIDCFYNHNDNQMNYLYDKLCLTKSQGSNEVMLDATRKSRLRRLRAEYYGDSNEN